MGATARKRETETEEISYEDFLRRADEDEPAEWDAGKVLLMNPASRRHQRVSLFLAQLMSIHVEKHGLGEVLEAPFQMKTAGLADAPRVAVMATIALLLAGLCHCAAGMCIGGDQLFFEVEIETCEPSRRIAEELIAESCRENIAGSLTSDAMAAELEKKSVTSISLGYRRWAKRAIPRAEEVAEKFRKSSAYFVIATTRILRIGRVPSRQKEAVWEMPDAQPQREMLVHSESDPNACAKLAGQRVVLEVNTPCCDYNPGEVLICVLGLDVGKVVPEAPASPNPEQP